MLFETPPLRLLRLSFELRPKRPMYMSVEERGNALRGGFGTAFRQLVCDPACPGAANCSSRQQCPYACLFEPIWPEAASRLGTLDVPRPFVFRPSLSPDSAFNSSRLLRFELRLMGQAVVHYEFFLRTFRRLASCGLGHARVPFDLVSVRSLDWSGQVPTSLLEDGCPTGVAPVPLTFQPLMEQAGHAESAVLDFVTPVMIKEHGVELRVPTFSAVLKRLHDRLSHLCLAYEGRRWEANYGAIGEAAARAVLEARKLIPHPAEAELVRNIFALYIKLGCVLKLLAHLNRENVKTKTWVTKKGIRIGGVSFARGHLYYLLRNRLYIGEIRHRERGYPGAHPGIVPRELWDEVQAQLDSNLRTQRKRAREQSSSLLTGLMEDGAGNRFTPSFTIKRGRRYRYYVSQAVIQNPGGQQSGPTRLPAHEIESRVTERLQAFLRSDAQVFDELSATAESPAVLHQLVAGAKKLAARLPSLPADDLRDLLTCILQRVIIQENSIQVMIRKSDLRELLEHGDQIIAASLVGLRKPMEPAELLCLTIEAKRKRYGGEIHLVVPPSSTVPVRRPRPALIKAVARGHAWYEKVLEGKVADMRSLARETGLTPHYVRNIFACAFLAPDIVEAILEGRQPLTLKFEHLYKNIPLSWAEQRQQFGFPQNPRQAKSVLH